MNEAEWLSCTSWCAAERMLAVAKVAATNRKTMLLAANWLREIETNYGGPNAKAIAGLIEKASDHEIDEVDSSVFSNAWFNWALATPPDELTYQFATLRDAQRFATREQRERADQDFSLREGRLVSYVRELFGNPFRPTAFSPEWRTDNAVALASGMYESRDFSAMPILADALQDAGCDNADLLGHCRDPQASHVRGCWVVDLVLGRE